LYVRFAKRQAQSGDFNANRSCYCRATPNAAQPPSAVETRAWFSSSQPGAAGPHE
jgi:hypothetical protein